MKAKNISKLKEPCVCLTINYNDLGEGYVRYKDKMSHKSTRFSNVKMEEGILPLNKLLYTYLRERERTRGVSR